MSSLKDIYYSFRYDLTRNRWIYEAKRSDNYGHILMFHHVTDESVDTNPSCLHKIDDFKQIILNYQNNGFEFVSVEKALVCAKEKIPGKFVVVTFDDIPDSVYTNAYPYLKEKEIPFTVFICVNMIDKQGMITLSHLKELSKDKLCTVGAHTMTHPFLRQNQNSKWEISQSKIELERVLRRTVEVFAYPFGRYSAVSSEIIKETSDAGFLCAFSTISAPLSVCSVKKKWMLPRIVPNATSVMRFEYDWTITYKAICSLIKTPIKALIKFLKLKR